MLHFVAQVLHFQMGTLLFAPMTAGSVFVSIYFALLFSAGHLHHEMIDQEGDREAGLRTGAVFFGRSRALGMSCGLFLLAHVCWLFLFLNHWIAWRELVPFMTAFFLQVVTLFVLLRKQPTVSGVVLRHRTFYRVYYLLAGVAYFTWKIVSDLSASGPFA